MLPPALLPLGVAEGRLGARLEVLRVCGDRWLVLVQVLASGIGEELVLGTGLADEIRIRMEIVRSSSSSRSSSVLVVWYIRGI